MKFTEFNGPDFGKYTNRKIILSDNSETIRFQIPRLYMPFGLSGFTPDVGQKKWNIDFALKGWDEDGNYTQKFYRFLKDLENKVIDHIHSHSQEIFGTQLSRDALESMFNSNLKENMNYDPKFRVKVDIDSSGMIKPSIFNANEEDITSEATDKLHSRQTGSAIVELDSIYFMNKRFGLTWKLQQLKVFPLREKLIQEPEGGGGFLKGFQFTS